MPHPQHPVSTDRLAANRANAAKSTSPGAPLGKARSAQNAPKHGFTASTFAVARLEELQEAPTSGTAFWPSTSPTPGITQ